MSHAEVVEFLQAVHNIEWSILWVAIWEGLRWLNNK